MIGTPNRCRWIACAVSFAVASASSQTVYVSRMWHNHQPTYWPEWNTNGSQNSRVEFTWDSIVQKSGRSYAGSTAKHPENNLTDIFGLDDRRNSYQGGPRNALANLNQSAGFCLSYSGSLIDGVRSLAGANQLGYGSGWAGGNREARNWLTPGGSILWGLTTTTPSRLWFRKACSARSSSCSSRPIGRYGVASPTCQITPRATSPRKWPFSRSMIDVLAEEGYQWSVVASHHISRTCPTYTI